MTSYSNLFIDLDDTVWDFNANSHVALAATYKALHLDSIGTDYETFGNLYYSINKSLWTQYHHAQISREYLMTERFAYPLRAVGYADPENRMAQRLNECYLELLSQQTQLVPHAAEVLEYLAGRGYRMYVLSNGFREVQARKLQAGGIGRYFGRVVLSDEIGITKPDRRLFDYALRVTGSTAATSLMIGDNYDADIMGAAHAGWGQIYFDRFGNGYTGDAPQYTIHSLDELRDIL